MIVDPVLGRRRRSTASATGGATATSRPPTPRPTSRPWGVCDRRRRAAQQPPCLPEFGEVRAAPLRVRHRLGRDHAASRRWAWPRCCASRRALDVRPNIAMPDTETLKALLAHPLPGDDRLLAQRAHARRCARKPPPPARTCARCCRASCARASPTTAAG